MIDAGYTQVRQAGSTSSDPLLRLTVFRRLTPSWNVNLSLGSEFQNAGAATQSALSGSQVLNGQTVPVGLPGATPGGGNGVANVLLNENVFHAEHASLSLDFVRPRTTIDLHANVTDQHYEFNASALDRELIEFGAGFTRRLRPSLTFHASVSQDQQLEPAAEPGYRYTFADAGFDWHAGSWLTIALSYHREHRPVGADYPGYTENVVYLGLTYGPPKHNFVGQPPVQPGSTLPIS